MKIIDKLDNWFPFWYFLLLPIIIIPFTAFMIWKFGDVKNCTSDRVVELIAVDRGRGHYLLESGKIFVSSTNFDVGEDTCKTILETKMSDL